MSKKNKQFEFSSKEELDKYDFVENDKYEIEVLTSSHSSFDNPCVRTFEAFVDTALSTMESSYDFMFVYTGDDGLDVYSCPEHVKIIKNLK
jgi:hypothetical protein